MKKWIPLLLLAFAILASSAFASDLSFSDVKETDWFAGAVSEAVALGLVNGKGTDSSGRNRFDPDGNITLAEAVKLAACMNQLSADGAVTLTNGSPWYESYADYGRSHFLVPSGTGFSYEQVMASPDRIISRAEFAWLFAHAVPADVLPEVNAIPDNAIPDVWNDTSDKQIYYPEIYTLYRAGIINGSDKSGSFLPASNIKRCEVAAIVVRMMEPDKRVGPPDVPLFPDEYCGAWVSYYGNTLTLTKKADGMCAFTLVEGSSTYEGILGVFMLYPRHIDTEWSLLDANGTHINRLRIICEDGHIRLRDDKGREFFNR